MPSDWMCTAGLCWRPTPWRRSRSSFSPSVWDRFDVRLGKGSVHGGVLELHGKRLTRAILRDSDHVDLTHTDPYGRRLARPGSSDAHGDALQHGDAHGHSFGDAYTHREPFESRASACRSELAASLVFHHADHSGSNGADPVRHHPNRYRESGLLRQLVAGWLDRSDSDLARPLVNRDA